MDCVFCNIILGKVPSDIVYNDDYVVAFNDINPKAKVHILIVPKRHFSSVNDVQDGDENILGRMILTAKKLAEDKGIKDSGYKLVINTGKDAGQIVNHLHMHLLGGENLKGGVLC